MKMKSSSKISKIPSEFKYSKVHEKFVFTLSFLHMESFTHPNRSTNLFNTTQTTQILYSQHRKKILRLTLHNRDNPNNLF